MKIKYKKNAHYRKCIWKWRLQNGGHFFFTFSGLDELVGAVVIDRYACNSQIDGLVQDCSVSSALAKEILQSYTKPLQCNAA